MLDIILQRGGLVFWWTLWLCFVTVININFSPCGNKKISDAAPNSSLDSINVSHLLCYTAKDTTANLTKFPAEDFEWRALLESYHCEATAQMFYFATELATNTSYKKSFKIQFWEPMSKQRDKKNKKTKTLLCHECR